MNIEKQHIILSLLASGRYEVDLETGLIYSNIGKEKRLLKPIKHYSGYLQYVLDIGFSQRINAYGQGIVYLARFKTVYNPAFVIDHIDKDKANNRANNLRCITEAENNAGNGKGYEHPKGYKRIRLPQDLKQEIRDKAANGVSFVRLAKEYRITRQTVARIVSC